MVDLTSSTYYSQGKRRKKLNELRIIRHSALQGLVIIGKLDNEFKVRTKAGILLA